MPAEHRRPDGSLEQGCYCGFCGRGSMSMMGHGAGKYECQPNPELVRQLRRANPGRGKPAFRIKAVCVPVDRSP